MSIHSLRFASASASAAAAAAQGGATSYMLFELPAELLQQLRGGSDGDTGGPRATQLEIRGRRDDDAVLVTPLKTYSLRSVQNSNSVMITKAAVGGPSHTEEGVNARGADLDVIKTVGETIEVIDVTGVAGDRLGRVEDLLAGTEYCGEDEEQQRKQLQDNGDSQISESGGHAQRPAGRSWPSSTRPLPHVTLSSLAAQVRASDAEISEHLCRLHALELEGTLRLIPSSVLSCVLSSMFVSLSALGVQPNTAFSRPSIAQSIVEDGLVSLDVANRIVAWYTSSAVPDSPDSLEVVLDQAAALQALGRCLLLRYPSRAEVTLDLFLKEWRLAAGGDASYFAEDCDPSLLASDALFTAPTHTKPASLVPFPSANLSHDPAARMRQLFAARTKWRLEELAPFLTPVTGGEKKKLDALVLKYCRKVKERLGVGKSAEEVTFLSARNNW